MKIGELANRAGVNIQTIRYYERRNILSPSSIISISGYRLYNEREFKKLIFIKQKQELGFTLGDIEELLHLRAKTQQSCRSVAKKAKTKLATFREKIRLLRMIEGALKEVIATCEKNDAATTSSPGNNIKRPLGPAFGCIRLAN